MTTHLPSVMASDPSPYALRIVRGGSWFNHPECCRSANPNWIDPGDQYDDLGFRVCFTSQTSAPGPLPSMDNFPPMMALSGGTFSMGEGKDIREVTIAPFAIGIYTVTFAEYDYFCKTTEREKPHDEEWGRGNRPVINVSWDDAQAYCAWLSSLTGQAYRLPSEEEWEYACRAGTTTRYPWGDEPGVNRANFFGSGSQWSGKQTAPVGSFKPNAFGLHDMIGNVWEWTQTDSDVYAVMRGGSWDLPPEYCRSAFRRRFEPEFRDYFLGFRVCFTPQTSIVEGPQP